MKDVKVCDSEGQVLFECSLQEISHAYNYASDMEEMGIEVTIKAPSLPETLAECLGANKETKTLLRDEIEKEIDSHNSPDCCHEKTTLQ